MTITRRNLLGLLVGTGAAIAVGATEPAEAEADKKPILYCAKHATYGHGHVAGPPIRRHKP